MKRSKGATIVGVYFIGDPLLAFLLGPFIHTNFKNIADSHHSLFEPWLGLLGLVCGFGILWLKEWARKLAIGIACFYVIARPMEIFLTGQFLKAMQYKELTGFVESLTAVIVINVLIVEFLNRAKTKEEFQCTTT